MVQIIHCCMLVYIVFVIAEIRNVLLNSDPRQPAPITIWEETLQQPSNHSGYTISYRP